MPARLLPFLFVFAGICFLVPAAGQAQDRREEVWSPRLEATWLYTPWRLHTGDHPEYANPALDDTGWSETTSALDAGSPAARSWTGIGWFRFHFSVDSSQAASRWSIMLQQLGAVELFLDGRPIVRTGHVSQTAREEKRSNRIAYEVLPRLSPGRHVFAVRFSNHRLGEYLNVTNRAGFHLRFGPTELIVRERNQNRDLGFFGSFFSGLFLAFSLLHLVLFVSWPDARENLFFSLLVLALAFIAFFNFTSFYLFNHADVTLITARVFPVCVLFACVTGLGFLYSVFYETKPRLFYWAAGIGIVLAGYALVSGMRAYFPSIIVFALGTIVEFGRVVFVAFYQRKPGRYLIGIGVGALAVGYTLPLVADLGYLSGNTVRTFPYMMSTALLVCASLYLSRRFSDVSRSLRKRLAEVEQLSQQTIEQERRLRREEIERQRVEADYRNKVKELEDARELQLSMLPVEVPYHPDLEIATYMKTATEVGGDYYDFAYDDNGVFTVVIGDATGHGMKAGTMVTATKSLFNVLSCEPDVLRFLQRATSALKRMQIRSIYMGLMVLKYDAGRLTLVSAGMPPVFIYRAADQTIEIVTLKGMPLGSFTDFPYQPHELNLAPGDTVVLMTDGYSELFNPDREQLDLEQVKEWLAHRSHDTPDGIIDHLVQFGQEWAGTDQPQDDMTFVVIRRKIARIESHSSHREQIDLVSNEPWA